MTISLKHLFTSAKGDGLDSTLIQPSNWNAEHVLTQAGDKVLGKDTGDGATQEFSWTAFGRSIIAAADAAATRTLLGLGSFATLSSLAFSSLTGKPTTIAGYGLTDAAAKTQTFQDSVYIEIPGDRDYRVVLNRPFAGTITKITTRCSAGTATVTGKINTTALGGTANSASTSEEEQAHASDNAFVAGDDIVLTVSSTVNCEDLAVSIEYTRVLA